MHDARHYREQAEFYLSLANLISNPRTAEDLRAHAADCLAKAAELEKATGAPSASQVDGSSRV